MIEQLSRRKLIGGLGLLIAAPAIVRASSLMPVKAFDQPYLLFRFDPSQTLFDLTINGVKRKFEFVANGIVRVPCKNGERIHGAVFTTSAPMAKGNIWA